MTARNPFSSSMPEMIDAYAAFGRPPLRAPAPAAYYFLRTLLIAAAAFGGVVALHRNDVFRDLSRKVGQEQRYLELERFIGTPGWGTPRSMEPLLGAETATSSPVATPTAESTSTPSGTEPATAPPVADPEEAPVAAPPTTAAALATAAVDTAARADDALAPVSLDSLPLLGARRSKETDAQAPVAARPATAPESPPVSRARPEAQRAAVRDEEPAPQRKVQKPPSETAAAKAPQPKTPKVTESRPNDNALLGAIRGAVRARPPKE